MQRPFYTISYTEGKEVFRGAMARFADFYGINLTDILVYAKYLRPTAFRNELHKYAVQYRKGPDVIMAHEYSHGITLPADGQYIVLVKYEKDESDTAEKVRETTYHELGHVLSLYQTNQRYPDREKSFQNTTDKNTEILLNIGDYVWQEFIAKYLAAHLITIDNQRMVFDMRNRVDMFINLVETLRMSSDNLDCYEKLTTVIAAALNSNIAFSEYTIPSNCGNELIQKIKTLYESLYQHCVIDADYTTNAEYIKTLGYYSCTSLMAARKHPLRYTTN